MVFDVGQVMNTPDLKKVKFGEETADLVEIVLKCPKKPSEKSHPIAEYQAWGKLALDIHNTVGKNDFIYLEGRLRGKEIIKQAGTFMNHTPVAEKFQRLGTIIQPVDDKPPFQEKMDQSVQGENQPPQPAPVENKPQVDEVPF